MHSAHTEWCTLTSWLNNVFVRITPYSWSSMLCGWLIDCSLCSSPCSFPCVSPTPCSSLPTSTCSLSWTSSSMWTTPRQLTTAPPPIEESCPLAEFTPHTGYEPKLLDVFHYSETTNIIFQNESSDKDAVPSYLFHAELDDETIGKALSSPLFIQEREEQTDRRQAYHFFEESLLPAQSFVCHSRTEDPCTNSVS